MATGSAIICTCPPKVLHLHDTAAAAAAAAEAAAEHSMLNQRLKGTTDGHRVCHHLHLPTKILHLHEAAAAASTRDQLASE
jgi:hypothetical protein